MEMLVRVKQKHIKLGQAENAYHCPIALALREKTGLNWGISYQTGASCFDTDRRFQQVSLSRSVRRFMISFDNHQLVKPFTFIFNWSKDESRN